MVLESWPGLPRGVQFNPSDNDLFWHLAAELGIGLVSRHPVINQFIKSADEVGGFGHTHPRDIPGIRQDGHASYFFHKKINVYTNENDENIRWQKSGASRSLILDGNLRGSKEVFVLYAYNKNDMNLQRTDWELHQYHLKDEEELVVSKIFYKSQNDRCERAMKAPVQSAQDDSVNNSDSKEAKVDARLKISSANMAYKSVFVEGNGNNQKQALIEMYPNREKPSSSKDVLDTTHINHENHINDLAETELDHISLLERYRIFVAQKRSYSARVSAEKCEMNDSETLFRQMDAETSGSVPKSESESVKIGACKNHEGTSYKEDMCSILQEISSAPPIIDNMNIDNMRSPGEVSAMECFAGNNEISHGPVNGKNLDSSAEVLSQTPTCGNENVHMAVQNPGTYLVDVKMEPASEGYAIYPSESSGVKSHHSSKNGGLEVSGSVTECLSKESRADFKLPHSAADLAAKTCDYISDYAYRNDKCSYSSEKVLEEDACKKDEGIAYPSRRKRKKRTATDSVQQALEEDAPGLLQILLDKGIMVNEIKLYDVEEDDGVLPDCAESNFQDLENVISKLFPQRASLLKSAARLGKGEKAIYCLACLISLIEQSRYLQFRDNPVEWGWCRDLQSFIFVFNSHNRLVLERPEYGYATYFFEILQSQSIEWQIRRLVTAMKLSSCGRTALIENRQLSVGQDLTEGEARVLKEYGWIPNTGLGTMLNYRDRVVHDRWNEKYNTDWRTKIGKLLMNGYSQGQLITADMTKKLEALSEDGEVKLEEDYHI